MASVLNLPNGRRAVQFFAPDGERRTIRLGKLSKEAAAECGRAIDGLIAAKNANRQAHKLVLDWLKDISDELADRLAQYDVIPPRKVEAVAPAVTLKSFLDEHIGKRTDVKPATKLNYDQVRRCLIEYFGADHLLDEITEGDTDEWRLWLGDHEKLAYNTAARRCGVAKQFFRAALRKRLIAENPFAEMKGCVVRENRERDYYITREEAAAVLDACPDAQWRLLFALSRFGGLRCPSEHLQLRWQDIDWERSKMKVTSPKTANKGKPFRWLPLFPELRKYLEGAWDEAEPGTEYVITRYRDKNANLRTQLERIIQRAGLSPWEKLFANLRATRATELVADGWPEYKVCEWLGHTEAVAKKHYWQVTDEDFQKAAAGDCNALQKALHQGAISATNDNQQRSEPRKKRGISAFSEVNQYSRQDSNL